MMLITGGKGKLGRELVRLFPTALAPTHKELDLIDRGSVFDYVKKHKPDSLIHCAALTGIKQCETNKELAFQTNVLGTENLVDACLSLDNPHFYFAHISTACVFYGDRGDYTEKDFPYPKNFYSLSKLLSEFVVKKMSNHILIRTNFVERAKWPYEKAFADRFGTYLFADDLAVAIKDVMKKKLNGIVHICGEEKLSMYELAKITTPNVQPMTIDEYSGPPLTMDMSLRSVRIQPYKLTRNT